MPNQNPCEDCPISYMLDVGCCLGGHQPSEFASKIIKNRFNRKVTACEYFDPHGSGNHCTIWPDVPPMCLNFNCGKER